MFKLFIKAPFSLFHNSVKNVILIRKLSSRDAKFGTETPFFILGKFSDKIEVLNLKTNIFSVGNSQLCG